MQDGGSAVHPGENFKLIHYRRYVRQAGLGSWVNRDIIPFKKGYWDRYPGDMLPSQYFHRNVFLGFQEDALGIQHRHIIGVDNLQWGSDYPHPEATFPRTRQILEDILTGCTEEEKAKIAGGNAARVYHFD